MLTYLNKVAELLFSIACKLIVVVMALAYLLDKAIDLNLFKIF